MEHFCKNLRECIRKYRYFNPSIEYVDDKGHTKTRKVTSEGEIALEKVRGAKLGRTAMVPYESRVALRTNSKLLFEKIEWSAEVGNVLSH